MGRSITPIVNNEDQHATIGAIYYNDTTQNQSFHQNGRRSLHTSNNVSVTDNSFVNYVPTQQAFISPSKMPNTERPLHSLRKFDSQFESSYYQKSQLPPKRTLLDWLICREQKSIKQIKSLEEIVELMSQQQQKSERAIQNWKRVKKCLPKAIALKTILNLDYRIYEESTEGSEYVMRPDSSLQFLFDQIVNLALIVSIFLTPFVIAFKIEPLEYLRWIEFTIDIILTLDILKNFFTGYPIKDGKVEFRLRFVVKRYLFSSFVIDSLATIPGLVTAEYVYNIYYFKVIRYIRIQRLFSSINDILHRIQKQLIHSQTIENFFVVLKTLLHMFVLFHVLACIWIMLSYTDDNWTNNPNILNEKDKESWLFMYVTSIYFVTTTATTVGYGDFYAINSQEKVYLLFLEFTGICTFSIISGNIINLKQQRKIGDIVAHKEDQIEKFLFEIDIQTPKDIDNETYNRAREYIGTCYLEGIQSQMKEGGFFQELTPQLKNKLVFQVLKKYYKKFYCFFNDMESYLSAPPSFVGRILVNLDCQIFSHGIEVIRARHQVDKLFFIYKGAVGVKPESRLQSLEHLLQDPLSPKSNDDFGQRQVTNRSNNDHLSSNPFLRAVQESLENEGQDIECLAILPEGSFFGDYQIFFNIPSNYDYFTVNVGETWLMSIKAENLQSACDSFPEYTQFLQQRALLRRNHFKELERNARIQQKKKLEKELNQQITLNNGQSIKIVNQTSNLKIDDQSEEYGINKSHLMNPDLIKLDETEQPIYKLSQQKVDINFTIPVLRMYLQGIDEITSSSTNNLSSHFNKFKDFFKIVKGVDREEDLPIIQEELNVYNLTKQPLKEKRHQSQNTSFTNQEQHRSNQNTSILTATNQTQPNQQKFINQKLSQNKVQNSRNGKIGTSKSQGQKVDVDEDILEIEKELNKRQN